MEVTARERNMKVHVLAGMGVGLFGTEVVLSLPARLALVICTALVIAGEAMNSALEALVDLQTVEPRLEARMAKDAAAGSVLAQALGALLVLGCVVAAEWGAVTAFFLADRWPASLALDVGILACTSILLAPVQWPRWPIATLGVILLVVVAARGASWPMTAMSGLLFILAAWSTRYRSS
jgi:diacylglycerol kinase (ATP)